jgi:hypothetical protein
MSSIDWSKGTKEEFVLIGNIAKKSCRIMPTLDRMTVEMDLYAVNQTIGLDLMALQEFDLSNLMHDIVGIANNINRVTGNLENCFLPRCAKHSRSDES